MDWQAIDSAPKDGTHIILWLGGVWNCADIGAWARDDQSYFVWQCFGGRCRPDVPTHWMPLPAPPEEPTR